MRLIAVLSLLLTGCMTLQERCQKDVETGKYFDMQACYQADLEERRRWAAFSQAMEDASKTIGGRSNASGGQGRSCGGHPAQMPPFGCHYVCLDGGWVQSCR